MGFIISPATILIVSSPGSNNERAVPIVNQSQGSRGSLRFRVWWSRMVVPETPQTKKADKEEYQQNIHAVPFISSRVGSSPVLSEQSSFCGAIALFNAKQSVLGRYGSGFP